MFEKDNRPVQVMRNAYVPARSVEEKLGQGARVVTLKFESLQTITNMNINYR